MPGGNQKKGPGIAAWKEFAGRHKGNPHLPADPLYALPEGLIDILIAEVPELFGVGEKAFERDLARTTGGGLFSRRRVVPCLLLDRRVDGPPEGLDRRIRDAEAEHLEGSGVSKLGIAEYDKRQAKHDQMADLRAAAYAGWLVADRRFRAERDDLFARDGSYVEEHDGFPSLPRSYLGESCGAANPGEARFHLFYRRWGLTSFLTWDLPLPLRPEVGVTTLDTFTLAGAGVTLFLPWYVAEDGLFSPDELAAHLKSIRRPAHLKGWLSTPAGGGKSLGDVRYRHYLVIFRYWGLVLGRRYPDRLVRRTMQLDRAFARFIASGQDGIKKKCGEDTIKKIRIAVRRAAESDPG